MLRRLMQLPEIEREDILAELQEEMQRIQDKRDLEQMLKDQGNRNGDPDSVSKAAKRLFISALFISLSKLLHSRRPARCQGSYKGKEPKARRTQSEKESKRREETCTSTLLSVGELFIIFIIVRRKRTLRSGTARHHPWTWKRRPNLRKTAKLPRNKNNKKSSLARPTLLKTPLQWTISTSVGLVGT
jgi:hypothetical protein